MLNKSLKQIITSHEFPHRFLVYFASQCSKDACIKANWTDARSLKAIEIAERFGNGEEFSMEELKRVHAAAIDARSTASTSYASASFFAATAISCAISHSYSIGYCSSLADTYKPLLLDLIEKRLTKLERLIILGV